MLRILAFTIMLLLVPPAFGQDFEKGLDAYQRFDYATAMRKWMSLAEAGDPVVQYYFGVMYSIGNGVAQDYVQAHMWLSLAAAQGNEQAAQCLEIVAKGMAPAHVSEAERLAREWQEAH